jgi:cytochrome P450
MSLLLPELSIGWILSIPGIIFSLYILKVYVVQAWMFRNFKGPSAVPLIGNMYVKEAFFIMRYLPTLRKKYGKIFTHFIGVKPYLVVCDPVVVRRILSDSKAFCKGVDYTFYFSYAFGEGLVTSSGEKHKKDRGIFGKFFIRSNIAKFTTEINKISKKAVNDLYNSDYENKSIDIEQFFATLALRVFMKFMMNKDYSDNPTKEAELCHKVSEGSYGMGMAIMLGVPFMWDKLSFVKKIIDGKAFLKLVMQELVAERKQLIANDTKNEIKNDDLLGVMIQENMSEQEVFDHFITLICAGHDTTAFFSSYMSYLLSLHQDVQDKVYNEIIEKVGYEGEITADHVVEMKYMAKVMQETLRLYSIIPFLTRVSTDDITIKETGITIPKGANIMMPLFLINRDPDLWENPSEFDPERFENSTGNESFTSAKNGFFPFGYGTRTCIGNTLSQIETAIFFCYFLRKFRITADKEFKPMILSGISLTTSNGVRVILTRR